MATYKEYIARVQMFASVKGLYTGPIDGLSGPGTAKALDAYPTIFAVGGIPAKEFLAFSEKRKVIAFCQTIFKTNGIDTGKIDGYAGTQTDWAFSQYAHLVITGEKPPAVRNDEAAPDAGHPAPTNISDVPYERDMVKVYGTPGTNHTKIVSPYTLRIAWNPAQSVQAFAIHEECHDSALRAMNKVAARWSAAEIKANGFDLFGGCFNNRLKRGGTTLSIHAYAAAIDWSPALNDLNTHKPKAQFSKEPGLEFLRIWESEGWFSLGLRRDYDYMHVQRCRI